MADLTLEMTLAARTRLAVFDCDGTIVDSQHSITSCMAAAFERAGFVAPEISRVRRVVGLPLAEAIAQLAPADAPIDEMTGHYSDAWGDAHDRQELSEPLFEGILGVFEALEADGWLLGVATGKSMRGLTRTFAPHALAAKFVTLQTADKARGKPDPEMLENAMLEAGTEPDATVMIGDTTFDMEMARRAGVRAVGVAWGYHAPEELRSAGAHAVASSMSDLIDLCMYAEEKTS